MTKETVNYERRLQERHEEMAPFLNHATTVGLHLDLGPPTGLYVREVDTPAGTFLGVIAVFLTLAACWIPGALLETKKIPGILALLLMAAIAGSVWFMFRAAAGRRGQELLYLFAYGFASIDRRGRTKGARWRDITEADWTWQSSDSGSSTHDGYRLGTATGQTFSFPLDLRNGYDPYGPVGDLLRAIPGVATNAPPAFPTLAEALDEPLITPMTKAFVARLRSGDTLTFGKATINIAEFGYASKPPLPWTELATWEVKGDTLRLHRATGKPKRLEVGLKHTPNGWLLVRTVAALTPEPEPPR